MLKNLLYKSKKIYTKIVWTILNIAFAAQFVYAIYQTTIDIMDGFGASVFYLWAIFIIQWAALRFAKAQSRPHSGNNFHNNNHRRRY